ncbi:MAG: pyrimidine 5'-nucleotidase [Flexilinea flocculi]|jgi:putative hydrolase of the HAD superfamily|nr:pyrimidine 5'-nucleotidase [Flexilinea flocculi]
MKIRALFFDLDETLYPFGNKVVYVLGERMNHFISEKLNISESEVKGFRDRLYRTYGTTAKGLVVEYGVDLIDFLKYSHDIDISGFISPMPELRQILNQIPLRKYILTNADRFHATRVLKNLSIFDCFDGIIDVLDVFPDCKPSPKAFEKALWMTGIQSASDCIFFDDFPQNVDVAHEMGFYAIQVGDRTPAKFADSRIDRIEDMIHLDLFKEFVL